MKQKFYQLTISIGCLFLYSGYINAACNQNPSFRNIIKTTPGETIYIQYDDDSSREIYRKTILMGSGANSTTSNGSECGTSIMYGQYMNGWKSGNDGYANTNIPGVSTLVSIPAAEIANAFSWSKSLPYNNGHQAWIANNGLTWLITLKKTGRITQSGTLTSGNLAELYQTNTLPSYSRWSFSTLRLPSNLNIIVLSCSLKNTVPVINLGDWYDTQFKNIGDTSTDIDIPITLSCLQGTNIKATITSTTGDYNASQGQLNLSGANKATGVAIQLIDKTGKPIPLSTKNIVQNNVPSGDYIFGWKARYIKTANNITPGPANATATVNIRYE